MSKHRPPRASEKPAAVRLVARDLHAPVRLDRFLRDQFPDAGRRSLQSLISGGRVSINGKLVRLSSWEVRNGDRVELPSVPRAKPRPFTAFDESWLIADDGDFIVVNKPAGLLAEPTRYTNAVSLLKLAEARFGKVTLFHRLDRDTSGVILLTRSQTANRYLDHAFQQRTVAKEYIAVVQAPNRLEASGVIDVAIGHHPDRRDMMAAVETGGKPATTHYQIFAETDALQWVQLQPHTGRTHQLRVHLAHLDAPILGDRLYSDDRRPATRLMLHALRIMLPAAEAFPERTFSAPIPADFLAPAEGWPSEFGENSRLG